MNTPRTPILTSALIATGLSLLAANSSSSASDASYMSTPATNEQRHVSYLDDGAWINDIGTLLYGDEDADGYFSGLSLSIDADSTFSTYEVYAVIEIIGAMDYSTEYLVERLHTTLPFDVYGRSLNDEYRVDIDLIQNYSSGIYDLRISLVDAHDHRLLDQVDANDFRNLQALALESLDYQNINTPAVDRPIYPANDDIVVTEYAGGSGLGIIALLITSVFFRLGTRRHQARSSAKLTPDSTSNTEYSS